MQRKPQKDPRNHPESAPQGLGAKENAGKPHSREDSGPEPEGQVDERFTKSGRHNAAQLRQLIEDEKRPQEQSANAKEKHPQQGVQGMAQGRGANPGQRHPSKD
jgi:hypothetical protein